MQDMNYLKQAEKNHLFFRIPKALSRRILLLGLIIAVFPKNKQKETLNNKKVSVVLCETLPYVVSL